MWHWWNDETVLWLAGPGLAALAIAVLAWLADRRRVRRHDLDAVGFMPWTGVFFVALLLAVLLLGLAARSLLFA